MATAPTAAPIEFSFDELNHAYYDKDGHRVLSVTQILKANGLSNYDMVPPEVLARKAKLGKLVHKACWYFDEGDLDEDTLHPEVRARLQGYKAFRHDTGYKPMINECQMIGVLHGMRFGMQYDSRGTSRDGRAWLVDIKNCATITPVVGIQLAGYESVLPKPLPRLTHTRIAVQLFADGTYKLHTFSDPGDFHIWQACLAVAIWKQNNKISME